MIRLGLLATAETATWAGQAWLGCARASEARGEERQDPASTTASLPEALIAIGDYAVGSDAEVKNEERFATTYAIARKALRVRMHGTAALDFALLAAGNVDAVVMLSNNVWDVAAGVAIAREAGALVLDRQCMSHNADSAETIGVVPPQAGPLLGLLRGATTEPAAPQRA
jgi:myo-inositol-1(or 4)-monophosphatase